ncbi:Alpha/Beta hydrolase protein [Crepidotus variabilis]|uniref:Lipase n=1 Tax=Crepidotus variabilis TaxID=179855 RepID=A0A9P6EKS9_9AGAR|nr:Alpha/Beta hydrolase protein [Crepidotus variabilis]
MGLFSQKLSPEEAEELRRAQQVNRARDFTDICAVFGYECEEHSVTTDDGYILSLKRILPQERHERSVQRPVVYLQHGLCTNCELFMAVSNPRRCLPLVLVENGYDVWLGNNRGNKYSRNHTTLPVASDAFWDFSIDNLAISDVPSSVSYVLECTKQPKLSYIGFSQGSAQAFAALSVNSKLNQQVNIFIALAPIMRPKGYSAKLVDMMMKRNPKSIQLFFGIRALFPIVSSLQCILPTFFLNLAVDYAVYYLLAFANYNITKVQKLAAYPHLYCASSVKAVVHWAQVMRAGQFIPFSDDTKHSTSPRTKQIYGNGNGNYHIRPDSIEGTLQRYPTENICTPIVLIHGDSDSLFDLEPMLEHLPLSGVHCIGLKGYEHLDVLWGKNVHVDVIPKVLEGLQSVSS